MIISPRIFKEKIALEQEGYTIIVETDNRWIITKQLYGMYEGAQLAVCIQFRGFYPLDEPGITILTPVYHPNIRLDGQIAWKMYGTNWSPALTIRSIMITLTKTLYDIQSSDVVNEQADKDYQQGKWKEKAAKYLLLDQTKERNAK